MDNAHFYKIFQRIFINGTWTTGHTFGEKIKLEPCCCCCCSVASVVSDSVQPQRRQPIRFPCPWDSPGKNTGVGRHFFLQCVEVKSLSCVQLLATSWTADYQAPPPMGFSRQEYWSGVPSPSPNQSPATNNQSPTTYNI